MSIIKATVGLDQPALNDEEKGFFLYCLANLDRLAVCVFEGTEEQMRSLDLQTRVITDMKDARRHWCTSYLLGWSWNLDSFMKVVKKQAWPDPAFREFVEDTAQRLGLVPFRKDDPRNIKAFHESFSKLETRWDNLTQEQVMTKENAYALWCSAHNTGKINVEP